MLINSVREERVVGIEEERLLLESSLKRERGKEKIKKKKEKIIQRKKIYI